MLGSTNNFFKQDKETLLLKRFDVSYLLMIKGYNQLSIEVYLKAYDYFCDHPEWFDGATIVKDLVDIPDLDLDALLHDLHYLFYNVGSSIVMKWRADKLFAKGQERKGKGLYPAYSRFVGLTLSGIGFIPFARLKRGKMTKEQKEAFMSDYKILTFVN